MISAKEANKNKNDYIDSVVTYVLGYIETKIINYSTMGEKRAYFYIAILINNRKVRKKVIQYLKSNNYKVHWDWFLGELTVKW